MSSPTSTTTPPATTRTLSPLAPGLLASILTPTTPFTPDADRLFASPKLTLYMIPASLTNDEACIVITDTDGKDTPHYAVNPVSLSWFCRKIEAMRKINSTDKLKITDAMVSFAESFLVILTEHTRRNWSAEQIEKANRLRALPELPPVPPDVDVRERTVDEWTDWILNHERRRDEEKSARDAESGKKSRRRGSKQAMSVVGDSEGE
jgi:hypothetical protein